MDSVMFKVTEHLKGSKSIHFTYYISECLHDKTARQNFRIYL